MKNRKKNIKLVLLLLVLCITIGYAAIRSGLNINGTTHIMNNTWDVHFENYQASSGSVTPTTEPSTTGNPTTVTYEVTLTNPGDYYEFTIDAVNAGTMDVMIESFSSKLNDVEITPSTLPPYLSYSATYSDGTALANKQELLHNTKETLKLKVGYRDDIPTTDLPSTIQDLNFSFTITYVQADDTAIDRQNPNLIIKNMSIATASHSGVTPDFSTTSGTGVYTTQENSKNVYYFRGNRNDLNNNVIFNNSCWLIVRTTSTKGIKLLYNGDVVNNQCTGVNQVIFSSEQFNSEWFNDSQCEDGGSASACSKYVGYVYNNAGVQTNSSIKTLIEQWYTNQNFDETKLENSEYCIDRSVSQTSNDSIYYGAYSRLLVNKNPSYNCPNSNDVINLKVGLLTGDEASFAGLVGTTNQAIANTNNYLNLNNDGNYWLITPAAYEDSIPDILEVVSGFMTRAGSDLMYGSGVRPTITVTKNISVVAGGTGSSSNPYVIS